VLLFVVVVVIVPFPVGVGRSTDLSSWFAKRLVVVGAWRQDE
jgi:hypothetical protein